MHQRGAGRRLTPRIDVLVETQLLDALGRRSSVLDDNVVGPEEKPTICQLVLHVADAALLFAVGDAGRYLIAARTLGRGVSDVVPFAGLGALVSVLVLVLVRIIVRGCSRCGDPGTTTPGVHVGGGAGKRSALDLDLAEAECGK